MSFLFHTILYDPIYNLLVFLTTMTPGGDIGLAIILLTLIIRIILMPLQHKQIRTQVKMKEIEPKMKDIQSKHKENKTEQSRLIMDLYKEHGVNPFSSIILLFIQIPILIALFWVFRNSIPFTQEFLYSMNTLPESVSFLFIGLIDLTQRSVLLAILVGLSQFIQIRLAMPPLPKVNKDEEPNFKNELARSMNLNMRYFMPVLITFIAATLPSVISLYWITSNIFMIGHELLVKRKAVAILEKKSEETPVIAAKL